MDEVPFSPDLVLLAPGFVMLALNVAAATLVVGLAAVLIEKLSRLASLPFQHGMLCVALLLVLTSPAPVWMAAQRNLGIVPIFVTSEDSENSVEPEESSMANAANGLPGDVPRHSEEQPPSDTDPALSKSAEKVGVFTVDPGPVDNPAPNIVDMGFSFRKSPANRSPIAVALSTVVRLFLFVWGAVGIWSAGRLLKGLLVVRRLQRSLRPSTDERLLEVARQVFAAARVTAIARLAESPLAPAPLTLGWRRAVIVVPDGLANVLSDEQLSCILAHEAAHVRRRDTWIALLQQLAAAAFWWNPFLHTINRQIGRLRERLCDDFAAAQRGQGVGLAHALVRVAEWSAARTAPSPMTSGLLEEDSDLPGRIERLTEADQVVSTRLSRWSLAALGGFGVLLGSLLLFPILRADEGESFDVVPYGGEDEIVHNEPPVDRIAGERGIHLGKPVAISVTGRVWTMDKKPAAGAKVYLLSHYGNNECNGADDPISVTHTDAEGRYQFQNIELPTIQNFLGNVVYPRIGTFQVCGEMDGFGIVWHGSRDYVPTRRPADLPKDDQDSGYFQGEAIEMNLTLRPEKSLTGRIVDNRGRPVENATVQLCAIDYLDTEGHECAQNSREFCTLGSMPARFHQTQTGADGSFEITGLPAETVARVVIEHADFADQSLLAAISDIPITKNRYLTGSSHTLDENDKPVTYPFWKTRSVRTSPLEIRVRATRRVLVDVVHERDGTPAVDVPVSASATTFGGNSEALSGDKTNEQGRATLKLPPGAYKLHVMPIRTSDDLLTTQEVHVADQPDEQTFKVPLKKGCTLTLQVVDATTGRGIPGVSFVKEAEAGEAHRNRFIGGFRSTFFSTNDSGECRAIVTPGVHRYGIEMAQGYPDIDPFSHKNKKEVQCEAGKTARLQFKLRK